VTLTGTDLGGATGVSGMGGPGVTVSNSWGEPTTVTATLTVAPGALLGVRNVIVTTAPTDRPTAWSHGGHPAAPTLASIAPSSGARRKLLWVVTLTGTTSRPADDR